MSTTIDQAFVQLFDSEVKLAYQVMGSKLRSTVRLKNTKGASTCRFQKLGKGSASQKSRHGDVPVMNAVHTYVDATMADWYAADYVDKLDEFKTNIDERGVLVQTAAAALGRKTDNLIITALTSGLASAQNITTAAYASAITTTVAKAIFKKFNDNDVPDDGNRVVLVGTQQWNDLLGISEFISSDYVGAQTPIVQGTQARKWLNMWWMMHTGLAASGSSTICIAYHKTAIGHGENYAVSSEINYVPTKAAFFLNSMLSAGSIRIDDYGVVRFDMNT
jgi:hypothetical protein